MTNPVQISENCWKHTNKYDNVYYRKTSDTESDLHREDGPAIECSTGYKAWCVNDLFHRIGGPVIEYASGNT